MEIRGKKLRETRREIRRSSTPQLMINMIIMMVKMIIIIMTIIMIIVLMMAMTMMVMIGTHTSGRQGSQS